MEFCESHTWRLASRKSLRAVNVLWALPVLPFSMGATVGVAQ